MTKHILVVDDAALVRRYYRDVLEGAGFAVDEAINGVEGLEATQRRAFDLVCVDVNMPVMDGYAMLRALRDEAGTRHVPALMISTEAQEHDATRAYAAGANLYLPKPVGPAELVAYCRLLCGGAAT